MKKSIIAFLLVLISIVLSSLNFASAEDRTLSSKESIPLQESVFILPTSLKKVEDGAFERTSVSTVVFWENVIYIGDQAFADASNLQDIYIPPSAEFIGANAFPQNKGLTIHGVKGSYAETWANKHRVPFVLSNIWTLFTAGGRSLNTQGIPLELMLLAISPDRILGITPQTAYDEMSMRPQDRSELNPINYRFP